MQNGSSLPISEKQSPATTETAFGILNINKPAGITSYDVVSRVKNIIGIKKVGHCGTLDPIAEGVLVILYGKATKLQSKFMGQDKVYTTSLVLGVTTDTYDISGKNVNKREVPELSRERIVETLKGFTGKIIQTVPAYSAVKYGGKRLYSYARAGIEVIRPKREVEINDIELLGLETQGMEIRVKCSCGTYIRSLVYDIGEKIGCGAAVRTLVREKSGLFELVDTLNIYNIERMPREEVLATGLKNYEKFSGNDWNI
jgi:tRNA pseudouridine55 synthase